MLGGGFIIDLTNLESVLVRISFSYFEKITIKAILSPVLYDALYLSIMMTIFQ